MGLKEKAVAGVKWNMVSTVTNTVIQILKLAILTRLLSKSDFGIIAIALMVIAFTEIFSELGLTIGIIHKQDITDKQYSSIYWLNVIVSILMFGVLCLFTPLLSVFYNEPILNKVIPLLGIQILLNGFGKMFQTIKTKNLEFNFLAKVRIASILLGFTVTIVSAVAGWGVYSLVVGQLAQVATNQLVFAVKGHHEQKILFHCNIKEISSFIKIGVYNLGAQILDVVSSKIDVFLIGKFFSMEELGVFNIAKDLILKPCSLIISIFNNVASATFAKFRENLDGLRVNYLLILKYISFIVVPIYFILFNFSDSIVSVLYHKDFGSIAVFIRLLFIIGLLNSLNSLAASLQIARGRTDLGFKCSTINVVFSMVVILAACQLGIQAVAIGQSLVAICFFVVYWFYIVYRMISISFIDYCKSINSSLVFAALPSVFIIGIHHLFGYHIYLDVVLLVFFVLTYLAFFLFSQKDFLVEVKRLIIKRR